MDTLLHHLRTIHDLTAFCEYTRIVKRNKTSMFLWIHMKKTFLQLYIFQFSRIYLKVFLVHTNLIQITN